MGHQFVVIYIHEMSPLTADWEFWSNPRSAFQCETLKPPTTGGMYYRIHDAEYIPLSFSTDCLLPHWLPSESRRRVEVRLWTTNCSMFTAAEVVSDFHPSKQFPHTCRITMNVTYSNRKQPVLLGHIIIFVLSPCVTAEFKRNIK